ncbi:FAD/NAD(P)-binding protein [Streptomyces sp. NBC_01304]|uniref:FAD/NAD(P)-binding protein n=1 Tax=Streptomyces sp. NBC_01304 TaxID=2903818 RepID=UPI002E128BD6|nr:FAD/NAD(P)-binding protein [Streptomyces sp. NBC_01304]
MTTDLPEPTDMPADLTSELPAYDADLSSGEHPYTIAVVGTGPRGISVLERLAVHLTERERPADDRRVSIFAIDDTEVGAGRVWRTDQDEWFTMNTVVAQVTMYSGVPDGGPARPGAGPSLGEWIQGRHERFGEPLLGPDDYASRLRYGQYLRAVYDSIAANLPDHVDLIPVRARVEQLSKQDGGGHVLALNATPHLIEADKVLLATGHPLNAPDPFESDMLDFAVRHPGLRYYSGDSAADMDLAAIPAGAPVGIRGLGLSFYDVMLSLTVGRGGTFAADGSYVPSGREPRIFTGSRSGLPIPARGRNQKRPDHTHKPLFLTSAAVSEARHRRIKQGGSGKLRFDEDVLPLLLQEVEHVYRTTHERTDPGAELPPLDLQALARPFADKHFNGPDAFRARLLDVMRADLDQAALGNFDGPLKAALDVLRDIRNVVREAVDYNGLQPDSHTDEFQRAFLPVNALLSAGPPAERVRQLVALIEAGVVEVAGPATQFTADEAAGRFRVSSPQVTGSSHVVDFLIDARIPTPDLNRDTSLLMRTLIADGTVSEYVLEAPDGGAPEPTGGLNVTLTPFHVVDAKGVSDHDLYALGIPTEHTRWFTQVGSGKPGLNTLFRRDADAIATDMLLGLDRAEREATVREPVIATAGRA